MGQIVLLAPAAAVFPTLIACVAVMISRPGLRGLLLAFYLGGLTSSSTSGVVVFAYFNDGNAVHDSDNAAGAGGASGDLAIRPNGGAVAPAALVAVSSTTVRPRYAT